jgi:hypothetical protein
MFVDNQTFLNGIQISTVTALPTADVASRGRLWILQGAAGIADTFHVVLKKHDDTYFWQQIRDWVTTENLTFFVDVVAGSDSNNGRTSGTAFKTIGKALSLVPPFVAHAVQINCAAGTYPELLNIGHTILSTGKITITGSTWNTFTPATGVQSGTFDAAFGVQPLNNTAVRTGAGWTVNNLKGKFLQITSGTLNGRFIPIASNTADTLDISATANSGTYNLQNVSFAIVEQAATLARDSVGGQTQAILWQTGTGTDPTPANTVTLENFKIDGTGLTNSALRIQGAASFNLKQCMSFTSSGAPTIIFHTGRASRINIQDSYLSSGAGAFIISMAGAANVVFDGLVVDGSAVGANITTNATATTSTGQALFQNCTTAGMSFTQSYLTGGRAVVRTCATGIRIFGQCRISPTNFVLTGNTGVGFHLQLGGGQNDAGSIVQTNGWTITGSTTAIQIDSSHNWVALALTTITGNSAWGVNLAGGKGGGFNQVSTTTATVMNTNTSGDFTLDNSVAVSLADLRADGDKDMNNTIRFNRLFEF